MIQADTIGMNKKIQLIASLSTILIQYIIQSKIAQRNQLF
jgi:hypothetical protein